VEELVMTTGLDVFDSTVQQTNVWLKEIMGRLGTDNRHRAYLALRATLHALRDRLPPESATHLAAQLPMLVRGFYYEDWRMGGAPKRERHKDEFLERIRRGFMREPEVDAERVARGVFGVLARELDPGEITKVIAQLPPELRELWPEHLVDAAAARAAGAKSEAAL
jgi:uncharacterized protein (DUF2267 family)